MRIGKAEKISSGRLEAAGNHVHGRHYYIEQSDAGRYTVRAKGSQRASDMVNTQRQAIERANELNPNDRPDVERVRYAKVGGDKWRSRE